MGISPEQLRERMQAFAIRTVNLFRALPLRPDAQIMGKQLLRSATSVGANYRAACRGRSRAEFVAKLGIVTEEADESVYWMELLVATRVMSERRMQQLMKEGRELTAIFTAAQSTSRKR